MWSLLALALLAVPDEAAVRRAADASLGRGRYQSELSLPSPEPGRGLTVPVPVVRRRVVPDPDGDPAEAAPTEETQSEEAQSEEAPPPAESAPTPPPQREAPPPPPPAARRDAPAPPRTSAGAGVLPWVLIALAVIAALVVASRASGPVTSPVVAAAPTEERARGERPLPDPLALARSGNYAEAIHALLLVALADVARRVKERAHDGLTGRELVRVTPRGVQAAMEPLLAEVERTHFGGAPATADDYARCAAQAQRIRSAWGS